jgi:hypothetical protein
VGGDVIEVGGVVVVMGVHLVAGLARGRLVRELDVSSHGEPVLPVAVQH